MDPVFFRGALFCFCKPFNLHEKLTRKSVTSAKSVLNLGGNTTAARKPVIRPVLLCSIYGDRIVQAPPMTFTCVVACDLKGEGRSNPLPSQQSALIVGHNFPFKPNRQGRPSPDCIFFSTGGISVGSPHKIPSPPPPLA